MKQVIIRYILLDIEGQESRFDYCCNVFQVIGENRQILQENNQILQKIPQQIQELTEEVRNLKTTETNLTKGNK